MKNCKRCDKPNNRKGKYCKRCLITKFLGWLGFIIVIAFDTAMFIDCLPLVRWDWGYISVNPIKYIAFLLLLNTEAIIYLMWRRR